MKYLPLLFLVFFANDLFAQEHDSNKALKDIVDVSIGAKSEGLSLLGNIVIAILNSCDEEKRDDCPEDDEDDIPYIKMIFGGEAKMGFNLEPFLLSGGYDLLSIPKDYYGEQITTSTFFIESQINLILDDVQSPYIFGQIGRSSFSLEDLMNHWRYTLGVGYKGGIFGMDVGYSFFNKPEEQQLEFMLNEENVFRVEESFLQSGFVALRLTFKLL